jgi:hypothetical protein
MVPGTVYELAKTSFLGIVELLEKAMTVEQTVEIPANRRITFDLPMSFPVGTAKVTIVSIAAARQDPAMQILDQPVELD